MILVCIPPGLDFLASECLKSITRMLLAWVLDPVVSTASKGLLLAMLVALFFQALLNWSLALLLLFPGMHPADKG